VTGANLALLARTAVHLRPGQIGQRARLRTQRAALRSLPAARRWLLAGPPPAAAVGWPAAFRPLDARIRSRWPGLGELGQGRIKLLGMTRTLTTLASPGVHPYGQDDPADTDSAADHWAQTDWAGACWEQAGAPALWRFHLHYWDWAWALAAEPDRADAQAMFGAMWQSWQAAVTVGRSDAWRPYPAALRAWSFCGLHRDLVAGSAIEDRFMASLAAHAGFLRRNLESDVGGNHLVKNLKALVGLGVFFADEGLLGHALDRLTGQLAVQVLPDGGHYELAPAYHCQVLGDLIDVVELVRSAGRSPGPALAEAIPRMRQWLGSVLSPAGQVPLLNDGYPVPAELVGMLRPGSTPAAPLLILPDSGLVRMAAGHWHLLADVGAPCPEELPAHAHADTFTCLVHVDGVPLVVDAGTSTYEPGPARGYERSTAAHNTVEVDGASSTEVWGTFRAARRARVSDLRTSTDAGVLSAQASHDGFRRLPGRPRHRRRWTLTESGLHVDDLVTGKGRHSVMLRWHLAPGSTLQLTAGGAAVGTAAGEFQVGISASGPIALTAETGPVATGFRRTVQAPVLIGRIDAVLPVRISTSWQRCRAPERVVASEPTAILGGVG